MGSLGVLALFISAVSLFTFIAFFGQIPAFRNTPIGSLHRVLWVHTPRFLARVDHALTGGRLLPSLTKLGNYLLHSKHCIVLCLFLGLVSVSAILFLPATWRYMSRSQKLLIYILLPQPYLFTYICQKSSPHSATYVSRANINEQLIQYPYDYVLYHPNNFCTTCELPKPARSKHCSLCKVCVARCDHHCVWVNNCVGRGNYKWFLALLLSTTLLLAYGTYLAYSTLVPEVRLLIAKYPTYYLSELSGRNDFLGRSWDKMTYWLDLFGTGLLIGGLSRAGVGLLAALTWPLPLGLFAYHIYLIWAGMTTNETGKWSDWREDMADGYVHAGRLRNAPESSSTPHAGEGDDEGYGHPDPVKRWPHRSRRLLVRTSDGHPPRNVPDAIKERIVDGVVWEQIWSLKDVDNIYDLGFWGNLKEVLVN